MSKKTKEQKRNEAIKRAKSYTWDNSKAKRKGTMTQDEWEALQRGF